MGPESDDVATEVVRQLGRVLVTLISSLTSWKTLLVAGLAFNAYIWALPVAERGSPELIEVFRGLVASSMFGLAGWVLFLITAAGMGLWVYMLKRSNFSLGEKVSLLRQRDDPDRLSTRGEGVRDYALAADEPSDAGVDDG
jgi:hypothetical protein